MRKEDRRRYNGTKPTWDVATGKRLWDDGLAIYEIANALHQPYLKVYDYARRNWYAQRY